MPALLGQGVPYPATPVDKVAWVLEQTHRFCDNHGLGFGAYPMHELAAHPQAPFTEASVRYLWLDRARRVGHAGPSPARGGVGG